MHALVILQHYLAPLLGHIHRRRLATLLDAVASCVSGPALSLTDIDRRFAGPARLRHKIKDKGARNKGVRVNSDPTRRPLCVEGRRVRLSFASLRSYLSDPFA